MGVKKRNPFEPLSRETIDAAKALYEEDVKATEIARRLTVSASTVSRYAAAEKWRRSRRRAAKGEAEKPARKSGQAKRAPQAKTPRPARSGSLKAIAPTGGDDARAVPASDADRQNALVDRLWRVAEKHVAEIEKRIGADEAAAGERDARALAVLTRMLRELAAMSAGARRSDEPAQAEETDDIDRDIQECRKTLTRLLRGLPASGADGETDPRRDVDAAFADDGDGLGVSRSG